MRHVITQFLLFIIVIFLFRSVLKSDTNQTPLLKYEIKTISEPSLVKEAKLKNYSSDIDTYDSHVPLSSIGRLNPFNWFKKTKKIAVYDLLFMDVVLIDHNKKQVILKNVLIRNVYDADIRINVSLNETDIYAYRTIKELLITKKRSDSITYAYLQYYDKPVSLECFTGDIKDRDSMVYPGEISIKEYKAKVVNGKMVLLKEYGTHPYETHFGTITLDEN